MWIVQFKGKEFEGFPDSSISKESACSLGDFGSITVGKIPWRRDSLYTPVFLGFPGGSAGKESACNAGDLGSIRGLGRFPWRRREKLPTPAFWAGEFHRLYSVWGCKEQDVTE